MTNWDRIIHASIKLRQKMIWMNAHHYLLVRHLLATHTANPTRVAMELLQLHDLKNRDAGQALSFGHASLQVSFDLAAVEVKQKAIPARKEVPIPERGNESSRPMRAACLAVTVTP